MTRWIPIKVVCTKNINTRCLTGNKWFVMRTTLSISRAVVMRTARISKLFCFICFIFSEANFITFTGHYLQDGYLCNSTKILFDEIFFYNEILCARHCGLTSDCLSISYDNVSRRCVGCKSFIDTEKLVGNTTFKLLHFEKEGW